MDPFEVKEITTVQLKNVSELASKMKILALGNGHKKDASLSKVKDQDTKEQIIQGANAIEAKVNLFFPSASILELLEVAKRYKRKYEEISRDQLPTLLNDVNMSSLTLVTGEVITIKDKLEASISNKDYLSARNNMIKEEYNYLLQDADNDITSEDQAMEDATELIDSKFKKQLVIDDPTEHIKQLLLDNDIMYDNKFSIHWQTLRTYCANQKAQGKNIPEGISIFEYSEAEIK